MSNNISSSSILPQQFFLRPAHLVARGLLGKYLAIQSGPHVRAEKIKEVEVYAGHNDLASHASRGKSPRNRVMFEPGGCFYVYLCYGVHEMLNIVTGRQGYPAAILIRGVGNYNGPGKLTKALGIDRRFNEKPANTDSGIWFENRGEFVSPKKILRKPRIGVDFAGPVWSQKPYRYILRE